MLDQLIQKELKKLEIDSNGRIPAYGAFAQKSYWLKRKWKLDEARKNLSLIQTAFHNQDIEILSSFLLDPNPIYRKVSTSALKLLGAIKQ